ncbi:MAG: hypothetical protein KDK41_08120 [Leptospiraceae bacterium]|nr:hypothetical protein [Leptospiraceae bacterium]
MEEKFKYKPEIDFESVDEQNSEKVIQLLEPFKKGILKGVEAHLLNADGLRKYLTSGSISPEFRSETRVKTKDIDDRLMSIVRAYSELETDLQTRNLDTIAHRDYFNYFADSDTEAPKVEYIKLLKSYEHLKEYNNRIKEDWDWLRSFYESIPVNSGNRPILEQILLFKIYPRIELTELTDLYLRRLRLVLKINKEEEKGGKVHARGQYTSLINYSYSSVFLENLESIVGKQEDIEIAKPKTTDPAQDTRDTCIRNPFFLDSRGTELFNQSYLYTMEIKQERVQLDQKKIKRAVYIETHLGAEEAALRQDLIRKFISQAGSKDRISEYIAFLNQYSDFARDTLTLHLSNLKNNEPTIFMYHFGPIYFLKVVMHFMREGRTGFIHRRLKKDQMLRELPLEYLKFTLKDWWDEKIFRATTRQERNSRETFLTISAQVSELWREEQPKIFSIIRREPYLVRAMKLHDVKTLGKFIETEVSYLLYVILLRFLGPDFIYLPVHRKAGSSIS